MRKFSALILIAAMILATSAAQPTEEKKTNKPLFTGFNPFSAVENIVEKAEVGLAGIIGGEELKAKALANNAEESLEEAQRAAEGNPERAARLIEKYEKNMNMSMELVGEKDENLSRQLNNISRNNIQRLKEVKQRVPEEARKGIQKAIENSKRSGRPEERGKSGRPATPRKVPGNSDGSRSSEVEKDPTIGPNKRTTGGKPENTGKDKTSLREPNKSEEDVPKEGRNTFEGGISDKDLNQPENSNLTEEREEVNGPVSKGSGESKNKSRSDEGEDKSSSRGVENPVGSDDVDLNP